MEQITKPHCGARLDRLPDCRWHSSMFAIVAFGLLVCWSNAVGGLILAQLKALGWELYWLHCLLVSPNICPVEIAERGPVGFPLLATGHIRSVH